MNTELLAKPVLLMRAAELLHLMAEQKWPADRQMERFFRQHRNMGAKDRGFTAEAVYGVLRRKASLTYLLSRIFPDRALLSRDYILGYLHLYGGYSLRALAQTGWRDYPYDVLESLRSQASGLLPAAVRAELPDELYRYFCSQWGETETLSLAAALNQAASLDLRVNTLKTDRNTLQVTLAAENITVEVTPYSPVGLRRTHRAALFNHPSFRQGLFEIQDEGSQLIAYLLQLKRRGKVVDLCAGGGGKTLHISALMENTGTVYAFDIHAKRLAQLSLRLKRANLDNVRVQLLEDLQQPQLLALAGKMDAVLVDAPCSGTGTLRRNPDMKWKPLELVSLTQLQTRLLQCAASLLRPGGRLVYATCSLLSQENESVITAFLETHPEYVLIDAPEILEQQGLHIPQCGNSLGMLQLRPDLHGTDGFTAAVMVRQN